MSALQRKIWSCYTARRGRLERSRDALPWRGNASVWQQRQQQIVDSARDQEPRNISNGLYLRHPIEGMRQRKKSFASRAQNRWTRGYLRTAGRPEHRASPARPLPRKDTWYSSTGLVNSCKLTSLAWTHRGEGSSICLAWGTQCRGRKAPMSPESGPLGHNSQNPQLLGQKDSE